MNIIVVVINAIIAFCSYLITIRMLPRFKEMFIKANLFGKDMCKKDVKKIPESFGVLIGCVFLVAMFLFIPIPFTIREANIFNRIDGYKMINFPHQEFVEMIVALLSICCMILLGFADDVLDLRWRHKLLLPTIASLPLLMVYYVNCNVTVVLLPTFARSLLGSTVDIGIFYYIYNGMLAVFCTNAINILAGINGLEVGQSIIIAASVLTFNGYELFLGYQVGAHSFSIYLMLPFLAVSLALWKYNKYPSQVFVGDTYCYFAGMTFAVVGILGHFSKTLILFFIPQIINFLYSVPQLFHFVPCPRHRLPKYDSNTDLLNISTTEFYEKDLSSLGKLMVNTFKALKIIKWNRQKDGKIITNNFTLINFVLVLFGPVHEKILTRMLLGLQIVCSVLALLIRYPLASLVYDT